MPEFQIGDTVRVEMPRGYNKRGVLGVSVLYTTSPEAKFEGATGRVVEVNPRGPYSVHQYLVDFRGHDNSRLGIPWQSQWFREEWLALVERRPVEAGVAEAGRDATGQGVASHQANQPPNIEPVDRPAVADVVPESPRTAIADDQTLKTDTGVVNSPPITESIGCRGREEEALDELASYAWSESIEPVTGADVETSRRSTEPRLRIRAASIESESRSAPADSALDAPRTRLVPSTGNAVELGNRDTLGPVPADYDVANARSSEPAGHTSAERTSGRNDHIANS